MTEYVDDSTRDKVIEYVLSFHENHLCFDCGSKNPNWASAYLGIIICFDCAARHRGYGTHISFIRSINLDRWNKKQLKSIEITGNKFAREKFIELGLSKTSGIYDYDSDIVQKYKQEIADKVKELLSLENYSNNAQQTNNNNITNTENKIKPMEEINFDDIPVEKKVIIKEEQPEYKEPTKFKNYAENIDVKIVKQSNDNTGTKPKRGGNKIQKVDFDFNFDNFNDVNFSSFNGNENGNGNTESKNEIDMENENKMKKKKKMEDEQENDDYKPKINLSKEEVNKKFANKKAISSEDYARLEEDPNQNSQFKNKLSGMKYSQAISSSDIYGQEEEDNSGSLGSRLKDLALGFTFKAAEKAKEFKDKTSDLINRIQNKYGNN